MFQWRWGLHFEKGGVPHGVIGFDGGGGSKKIVGWGRGGAFPMSPTYYGKP